VAGAAASAPPRVHAAIVTYNRGALLVECLHALLAQTVPVARAVVVDNASTDGTPELLAETGLAADPRVVYERQERNLGGAGGYARAVALAREGADWVWVMDDDAEARPDALERLLQSPWARDPETAVLCQSVVRRDGSVELTARGHFERRPRPLTAAEHVPGADLGFASLVGLLVRGEAARATDPPRADFFIWCDDYEWCLRLRRHGRLRLVPESEVLHKELAHGFSTRRSRLVNRLTGWNYAATPYSSFWRNICGVRNYVWLRKHHLDESALGAAVTVAQFAVKALLYDEKPLRRLPWIVRAGLDGRRGVFHTITPQEWAQRLPSGPA
jgi:rhamnopyranosyl-N-acetylglucosaminyl-diphospho-decaprenol beta-1,3/1,4-galactofuranosyltransferase